MKKQKGITLVALVVTIVILVILTGISISALTNQGIFAQAKYSVEKYKNAQENELRSLDILENEINESQIIQKPVNKLEVALEKTQIEVRETTILSITVKPDDAYNKEVEISYDETKISIGEKNIQEDGTITAEVTAIEAGETSIVVTSENGYNGTTVRGECYIYIVNPQPIDVFQAAGTWTMSQYYTTEWNGTPSSATISGNQISWTCPKADRMVDINRN